ncbi:DMT family transporter [Paenibacillus sp. F411]|uniref:DMT family transporter n=1 Tax=Paenibacillus sp. F411 TaxID=2820239 RepID=UPI001AAE9F4E|nr:DMT family transporter [Paenibacillus sp. F411]MBO2942946.1 DMT family transporter [Paenibacillus sp. F411]
MIKSGKAPIPVLILLLIGITAISFSSIFVKWSEAPVSVQAMYRLFMTAFMMLPFVWRKAPEIKQITPKQLGLLFLSGFMLALHFLLWMGSLRYTSVASSTLILALEPVFVMLGAYIWFKERTSLSALVGVAIAFMGIFLLMGASRVSGSDASFTGDMMSLLGTAAVAVHMLLGQSLMSRMSSLVYSWMVFLSAAMCLGVYNMALGIPVTGYPAKEWGIFLLLAIVPTVFGHLLFNWMMRFSSASVVSMSVLGEPVGASLLAFILLHETMNAWQFAGGFFVMCGLIWFLRYKQPHSEPAPPMRESVPQL